MAKAKKHRGALNPHKYLDRQQAVKLLKYVRAQAARAAANGSRRALTNEMIVELMLKTALRAEETIYTRICDTPAFHGKPCLFVRRGKGRITRSVPISEALTDKLSDYIKICRKHARPGSALFASEQGFRTLRWRTQRRAKSDGRVITEDHSEGTSRLSYAALYQRIRRLGEHSGIGHLTPHMLRHTCLTQLYETEKDIEFVRLFAGHSSLSTTSRYIHASGEARSRQIRALDARFEELTV